MVIWLPHHEGGRNKGARETQEKRKRSVDMGHIVGGALLAALIYTPSYLNAYSTAKGFEDKDNAAKRVAAYWAGCLMTAALTMLFYLLF